VKKNLSRWFWPEIALASIVGLLGIITPFFPDWIEVSGWDPDQHDGSVERMIVIGLCVVVSIAIFALAAVEWRRTASAGAP
jgi:hypothetical protein